MDRILYDEEFYSKETGYSNESVMKKKVKGWQ